MKNGWHLSVVEGQQSSGVLFDLLKSGTFGKHVKLDYLDVVDCNLGDIDIGFIVAERVHSCSSKSEPRQVNKKLQCQYNFKSLTS